MPNKILAAKYSLLATNNMQINTQIIRGYDIRGIVDKDLNARIAEHFGKAYGTYISKAGVKEVIVGRDSRLTSEDYKNAFIQGVISTGLDVIDIGLVMVGMVYWAQYHFNTRGAAMITASHNPKEYNGFKLAKDFSESLIADELQDIAKIIKTEDYLKTAKIGKIKKENIQEVYLNDLVQRFNIKKNFKIVVDPSCTTPGVIVPPMLEKIGAEVICANCKLDGNFPLGVADPTETIVARRLRDKVLAEKADIGFSYDTDGDRLGIVDERGTIVWNDVLVALFAIDILDHYPGSKIMYNTLCSRVVEDTIREHGGEPFMWRTGHGFLKKKNQEVKAPFIGELSGHFFFSADFYNHDDGCYATLRLLDYLSRTDQSLGEALEKLPKYISSPEIKLGCPDDIKRDIVKKMGEKLKKDFPKAKIIDDERAGDGVRLDTESAMLVIRYSQNGPYLTIKFEAKKQNEYDKLKKYLKKLLKSYSEIQWEEGVNVESFE